MRDENNNQVKESLSSISTPAVTDPDAYLASFPPGYRFAPTDAEIILHYLTTKVENQPIPINKINEVNLYDHPPEYFTSNIFKSYEKVWYYYTSRDRKYRNGLRPNRSAGDGYWKATGVDKKIKIGKTEIGSKKTLVFYRGKAPKGDKTDWIMHEFRVDQSEFERNSRPDMLLDNYVLCRIYNKGPTKSKKNGKRKAATQAQEENATSTNGKKKAAAQAQEENATSTMDPMEHSNEKGEEDQGDLNKITDEPATEVGHMPSNFNDHSLHSMMTSSMTDTFEGITSFDDPFPYTAYIPQQTYHHPPLRVQINNNYMNDSISTSTDDFSTYDSSHVECGTFYDGSDFINLDYNDTKSSLSVNQQVPPGNYDGSPLSVNQKVHSSTQTGFYDGRKEIDNIFPSEWIGTSTTAPFIPNYCQDYPYCPALPRRN